jgi:DNA mismatch repair protein MutH
MPPDPGQHSIRPPASEQELLLRAGTLAGKTLRQIAGTLGVPIPRRMVHAKGWIGTLMERYLGAGAGSLPEPDFAGFGIELKTLPVGKDGRPKESTYICTVTLLPAANAKWENSPVKRKLSRVLWIPVEAGPAIPIAERRIGSPLLWSPDRDQEKILRQDWEELMEKVMLGNLDHLSARLGKYLQIRPKARDARSLGTGTDAEGHLVKTLPRGFYLRTSFTQQILEREATQNEY